MSFFLQNSTLIENIILFYRLSLVSKVANIFFRILIYYKSQCLIYYKIPTSKLKNLSLRTLHFETSTTLKFKFTISKIIEALQFDFYFTILK